MARPLRLEFAGAVYHVTARGERREDIYLDDDDRQEWIAVLSLVCERFNWVVHAFCQMTNHYHFRELKCDLSYATTLLNEDGLTSCRTFPCFLISLRKAVILLLFLAAVPKKNMAAITLPLTEIFTGRR